MVDGPSDLFGVGLLLGSIVGDCVGLGVVGLSLGIPLGFPLGLSVRGEEVCWVSKSVGTVVGAALGRLVVGSLRRTEGSTLVAPEGVSEGSRLGPLDGFNDGLLLVSKSVGFSLGLAVGSSFMLTIGELVLLWHPHGRIA